VRSGPTGALAFSPRQGAGRSAFLKRRSRCAPFFSGTNSDRAGDAVDAHVDVRLEGERRVEHRLDALQARRLDRLLNALRVCRGVLDDVAAGHGVEAAKS